MGMAGGLVLHGEVRSLVGPWLGSEGISAHWPTRNMGGVWAEVGEKLETGEFFDDQV